METPTKTKMSVEDSAVVSRSGRIRRKSSKLAEFESSEDIEAKNMKKESPDKNLSSSSKILDDDLEDLSDFDDIDIKEEDWDLADDDNSFMDVKLTDEDFKDDPDMDPLEDPLELPHQDMEFDLEEEAGDEDGKDNLAAGVAQSLYFSEKQSNLKKGAYKDGQQTRRKKAQRKDKGKSRFTAYMLWARDVRPDIIKSHPDMDFASVNKKLGELWQLVPTTQKYNWKRRAKRLAVRLRQGGMISTGRAAAAAAAAGGGGKNNTASTAATQGGTSNNKQHGGVSTATGVSAAASSGGGGGRQSSRRTNAATKGAGKNTTSPQQRGGATAAASTHSKSGRGGRGGDGSGAGNFKVTGTTAIDVAAHMKLLGESLNNIGHKLKEHEGQIAVSGSLSVLLDSMLCVLGPLMCLTDQVEETRGAIDLQTHAAILDNIAYIMPGIV